MLLGEADALGMDVGVGIWACGGMIPLQHID